VDRIDRSSGGSLVDVEVVKEDYKEVTYRKKGSARAMTVPAESVVEVVRGNMPPNLREGRAKLLSGDMLGAVGPLRLAAREGDPWVKEYASFYLGEALSRLGETRDAIAAYEGVLQVKPDSRLLPQVRLGIAQAHMTAGAHAKADDTLTSFLREIDSKGMSRTYALNAKHLHGASLVEQKKFGDAAREYDSLIREAQNLASKADASVKRTYEVATLRAEASKARALLHDNKVAEARSAFSRLAGLPDPVARSIGRLGEAEVSLAQGDPDRARVLLSEMVSVHFGGDEDLSRALHLLARCYLELRDKQNEKNANEMARRYLDELLIQYPGSDDAKAARVLQKRLK
jgi:TolA-binding protein